MHQALLHTPVTLPEMIEYGFAVSPGTEAFYAVSPSVIHADEAIHGIDIAKRGCYLEEERELTYFKHYTFLNCFMECVSNYTFQVGGICEKLLLPGDPVSTQLFNICMWLQTCDCVAYYMPRNPFAMPICAPEKSHCVDEAVTTVEESAYDDKHFTNTECHCLPSCTDMEFPHETSASKLSRPELLSLSHEVLGKTRCSTR